jgi:acyl transferase domain-containing protein/acyl carrier protein
VAFLFPGQGSPYAGVGRELYQAEPVFRHEVDRCAEILRPHLGGDLRDLFWPPEGRGRAEEAGEAPDTALDQPALFVLETALARLWISWGVRPQAMLGHSLGEYVAAHLAGVFTLEDALELVVARGRLMREMPAGAMLAVPLAESEIAPRLGPELSLAAINGPSQCVVSGPVEAIERLAAELAGGGVEARRLATSHAFHSRDVDPLVEPLTRLVRRFSLSPPEIPFLSNVTGGWATAEEMTDPAYWGRHLRRTVRFAAGLTGLLAEPGRVLLEVGPGRALTRLARRQGRDLGREPLAAAALDTVGGESPSELAALLSAAGRLWRTGVPIDWASIHSGERRRRISLPTYPFERERHWITLGSSPARRSAVIPAPPGTERAAVGAPPPGGSGEDVDLGDDPILNGLAAIWREVLGVRKVGPGDLFLDLGGDSLIALQVMSRLREAFPVDLPVRVLFERPSLAGLSAAVEEALTARLEELPEEEAQRLVESYLR